MMDGEKPGGHGERCVAVGTLDMAIWDAAAKIADKPLARFLAAAAGRVDAPPVAILAYASGGYAYPDEDIVRLKDEFERFLDLGFTRIKMKIGRADLADDFRRVSVAQSALGGKALLSVDAMNAYSADEARHVVASLNGNSLWWLEDLCDPHDFETQARASRESLCPVTTGEALFSLAEARLLDRYGDLDRARDILVFDPVHCYGLTEYLRILEFLLEKGWSRHSFWPHGGSLFSQHIVAALGLGGAEINPLAFAPFNGLAEGQHLSDGRVQLSDAPGIGFERHAGIWQAMQKLDAR